MSELTAIEQKEVPFQDGEVTAIMVQDEDGRENVYVPLKPLVEGLGLDWSSQYKRVKRNEILNKVCSMVMMTTEHGKRQTLAVPISHLNGFLFKIDASRVSDEIRPLVLEYQEKCYQVLFQAFNGAESMRRFYTAVGFDSKWISRRMEKHRTSTDLTDVWLLNSIPIEEHSRLDDLINQGAFGLTTTEHRQLKNLPESADLRDNMTTTELLISAMGDEATFKFITQEDPEGLNDHIRLAEEGGKVAGEIRDLFERRTGTKVLSDKNNLDKQKRPSLGDKRSS